MLQILGDQSGRRIKKQTVFMHAVCALWTILANRCHCSRESSPKHKISKNVSKKKTFLCGFKYFQHTDINLYPSRVLN